MLHTGEAIVREEAINRCHEHAQFLASHFEKEEEFHWAGKDFTKYIKGIWVGPSPILPLAHPLLLYQLGNRELISWQRHQKKHPGTLPHRPLPYLQPPAPPNDEQQAHKPSRARSVRQESTASAKSQSPATKTAETQPPTPPVPAARTETPKLPAATAPAPVTSSERSEAIALKLYQAIVETDELDKMDAKQIGRVTLPRVGGNVFYKFKFSAYKGVPEAMRYYAQDLVRLMNADNALAAKWRMTPFYATLASIDVPLLPDELQHIRPEQIDTSLVRRLPKNANGDPPAPSNTAPTAKPSGKAPPPAGYQSASDTSSSLTRPRRGRLSGKVAGLRLANPKKRPHSDANSPASSGKGTTGSKRSRMAVNDLEEEEDYGGIGGEDADGMNIESESSESSEDMAVSDGEPDQVPARIVLEVEDLPSTSPMGPNGTWVCENEDCGHVIRCADEPEGQEAVRMHLHEHEDRSRKVRLAMAEGRATGHPSIE